jgi:hypothetical protein
MLMRLLAETVSVTTGGPERRIKKTAYVHIIPSSQPRFLSLLSPLLSSIFTLYRGWAAAKWRAGHMGEASILGDLL